MIYIEIISIVVLVFGLLAVFLLYMLNFLTKRALKPKYLVVSKNLSVSNQWTDLPCQKPPKRRGNEQHIYLKIPEYEFDWSRKTFDIQLPDGTVVRPEMEVVDELGNVYAAMDGTRMGNLVGFTVKINRATGKKLSVDQQNVIVKIRSFVPFECSELGWYTKRMK